MMNTAFRFSIRLTRFIYRIASALMAALVFYAVAGCSSAPDDFVTPGSTVDYSSSRIDKLLANGDNLKVLPLIKASVRLGDQKDEYYRKALEGLTSEWHAARSDGDWKRALIYLRSFQALGESSIAGDVTENDLFLQGVYEYLKNQKSGAAASVIQSDLDINLLSPEVRSDLATKMEELGHHTVAAVLRGVQSPVSPGMVSLVDGTVTVWVNRGIRLVGNVGIPDRGIGSGFFIDPQGYLLTNYHVIDSEVDPSYQGYSRLFIKVDDESGERIPARVIGWDQNLDLALLKTEMPVPFVFSFSQENVPALGATVNAIGSPGGLTRTLTSGTVSAFARSIQPMSGSLQIDVPINPGNSGGPLLNRNGEVIGVIFAGVVGFEGINFAIPGNYVRQIIPSLFEGGQVKLPWMGVAAADTGGRIEITYVVPGSPAEDTGLKSGDIIRSVDDFRFQGIRAVQEYLISRMPATITSLTWEREGAVMEGIITLGVRPDIPLKTALARDAREHLLTPLFGLVVERVSGSGVNQTFRVVSVFPGSIADETGFAAGDNFTLRKWIHDEESDVVAIQIVLKGRKAGFLESGVQIASYLNINTVF